MYLTKQELASVLGCSERTISRNVTEMERCGNYPDAVIQLGRIRVSREAFEDFLQKKRRMKWKTEEK